MTPVEWIRTQQSALDALIADAARSFPCTWPPQDLQSSADELYALAKERDVCYDRPSIAVPYALFYQGRRIQDALQVLHDPFVACPRAPLEVVDLGVGTGATPLALGLLLLAYAERPEGPSCVRLVGLDASPFMIAFARHLLECFASAYPALHGRLGIQLEVCSWRNADPSAADARRWLIGNYVFDHSEQVDDVSAALARTVAHVRAQTVFLQGPSRRTGIFDSIEAALGQHGFTRVPAPRTETFFSGVMSHCAEARGALDVARGYPPTWDVGETRAAMFAPIQPDLLQSLSALPDRIDLFLEPVRVRREARLTPEQHEAAEPDGRPTLIVGPAGCGKSLVLTERIKRVVTDPARPQGVRVLVSTFNRNLLDHLAWWLADLLPDFKSTARRADGGPHEFVGPDGNCVLLLNLDKLPTRLFGIGREQRRADESLMREVVDAECTRAGLASADHTDVLSPAFLFAEYTRVFYGQRRWTSRDDYCRARRVGRGTMPVLRGPLRALVWDVLKAFDTERRARSLKDFAGSRLDTLESTTRPEPFTHVFYDELQDLTPADFDLLYRLAADANEIVLTGDLAQAFFVGRSYHVPREEDMARRNIVRLTGSYRLPLRIGEALQPLAARLLVRHGDRNGISPAVIEPSRWAPPGARPIVIHAPQAADLFTQVRDVLTCYAPPLDLRTIVIVERDIDFANALNTSDLPVTESIESASLKILKGLERDCVLWAAWQPTPEAFGDAALEMVYTALTRAGGLLVLMLTDTLPPLHREVLGLLDARRLIFWTDGARAAFDRLKIASASSHPEQPEPDEDESVLA